MQPIVWIQYYQVKIESSVWSQLRLCSIVIYHPLVGPSKECYDNVLRIIYFFALYNMIIYWFFKECTTSKRLRERTSSFSDNKHFLWVPFKIDFNLSQWFLHVLYVIDMYIHPWLWLYTNIGLISMHGKKEPTIWSRILKAILFI